MIRLNTQLLDAKEQENIHTLRPEIQNAQEKLITKTGAGSAYLGWLEPISHELLDAISPHARELAQQIDVLVVIGIGGSYLGCRAVYELLRKPDAPKLVFLGHHMGSDEIQDTLSDLDGKEVAVSVISKSGTTTEPAIAFRIMRAWLEERYDEKKIQDRIITITDPTGGALRKMTEQNGYTSYEIPGGVGGRYSVMTPVGLFPLAVAGIDIHALATSFESVVQSCQKELPEYISIYVAWRNAHYRAGKKVEILSNFSPKAHYLGEWWKQLFGESEGKEGKGLYPDTLDFSTDLHSLGQYVQEGERIFIQTCIRFCHSAKPAIHIEKDSDDHDKLNYLTGKTVQEINHVALDATMHAHHDGGVPVLIFDLENKDEATVGAFMGTMMYSCALSGYVLGVNPFNQPGVEAYKTKMFEMLGKPNS